MQKCSLISLKISRYVQTLIHLMEIWKTVRFLDVDAPWMTKLKRSPMKRAKWSVARFYSSSRRNSVGAQADSRYDDDFDAGAEPSTPTSTAPRISNFYFAQLEEIERFGLTTLYVEYDNLEKFTVNGETGVLAQAIAQQYYRFLPFLVRALHQFIKKYKPEHYITVIAPPSSPAKPLHIA